jgi:hypothetical protein
MGLPEEQPSATRAEENEIKNVHAGKWEETVWSIGNKYIARDLSF